MTPPLGHPSPPTPSQPATTITARCPDDVIAIASIVLGFTPHDSVVMLTFGAEHPFHARLDLPDAGAPATDLAELDSVLLEPASRHRARKIVLLLYSDDPARADPAWPVLRDGARRRGLHVVEALRVSPERWFPYLGGDQRVRAVGVPYDVSVHPFRVHAVMEGRVMHGSRGDLAATIDPRPQQVASVVAALGHGPDVVPGPAALRSEGAWVQDLVARHVAAGSPPSDAEVARLLRDVQVVRLRDAAWALIDRRGARAHLAFWTDVVRRCPEPLLPPVATMLAWSAWQAGDGALAWCGIDRCLAVDPDYSLAHLVGTLLEQAVPPSSWEGGFDWAEGLAP